MKHDRKEEIMVSLKSVLSGGVYLCETAKTVLKVDVLSLEDSKKLIVTKRDIARECTRKDDQVNSACMGHQFLYRQYISQKYLPYL